MRAIDDLLAVAKHFLQEEYALHHPKHAPIEHALTPLVGQLASLTKLTISELDLQAAGDLARLGSPIVADLSLYHCQFADFADLSRNRPAGEDGDADERVHSSRERFHTFLTSLDVERGALPDSFRDKLARVLAHYGVDSFDRTPQLEEAVFRVFLAQQRSAPEAELVTALLQAWLTEPAPSDEAAPRVREVLAHLVTATQLRFPVVGDLARSVRFRWFDQPLVDAERTDVLDAVKAGASGYLLKSAGADELVAAVRDTAEGRAVFTPELAGLVLAAAHRG